MERIERLFEITKFLHKPRRMEDIKREFKIKNSTLSHMFTDPKISFLNVEFPLYRRKITNENEYISDSENSELIESNNSDLRSTVHPIVLPLNLTEVFMLTNHLLDITRENEIDYRTYKEIVNKIYPQLSEYAKRQIGDNRHYLTDSGTVKFTSEEEMFNKDKPSVLEFALKSESKVKIILKEGKGEIVGKVMHGGKDIFIETDDVKYKYSDIKYDVLGIEKVAN